MEARAFEIPSTSIGVGLRAKWPHTIDMVEKHGPTGFAVGAASARLRAMIVRRLVKTIDAVEKLNETVIKRDAREWEVSPRHVEHLGECVRLCAYVLELTLDTSNRLIEGCW